MKSKKKRVMKQKSSMS